MGLDLDQPLRLEPSQAGPVRKNPKPNNWLSGDNGKQDPWMRVTFYGSFAFAYCRPAVRFLFFLLRYEFKFTSRRYTYQTSRNPCNLISSLNLGRKAVPPGV